MVKQNQKQRTNTPSTSPSKRGGKKQNKNKTPETIREEKKKIEQNLSEKGHISKMTEKTTTNDDDTNKQHDDPNQPKTPTQERNSFNSPPPKKTTRGRSPGNQEKKNKEKKQLQSKGKGESPKRSKSKPRTPASASKDPPTNPNPITPKAKQANKKANTQYNKHHNQSPEEDPKATIENLRQLQHETRVNAAAAFPDEPFYPSDTSVPEAYQQLIADAVRHEAADARNASPGHKHHFLLQQDDKQEEEKDDMMVIDEAEIEDKPNNHSNNKEKAAAREEKKEEAAHNRIEKEVAEDAKKLQGQTRKSPTKQSRRNTSKDQHDAQLSSLQQAIDALKQKQAELEKLHSEDESDAEMTVWTEPSKSPDNLQSEKRRFEQTMKITRGQPDTLYVDMDSTEPEAPSEVERLKKLLEEKTPAITTAKRPTLVAHDPENIEAKKEGNEVPRPYCTRVDIKLRTEPSTKPQSALNESITKFFEILQEVDKHVAIYPYEPSKDGKEPEIITDADKIPTSTYDVQKYFKGAQSRSTDSSAADTYCQVWIGLSKPFAELIVNCNQVLKQNKFGMWEADLQVPSTVKAGWLVYSHRHMQLKTLKDEITRITGIEVGLRWKVIAGQKWDKNIDNKDKIRAIHVEIDERHAADDSETIHDLFSTSKTEAQLFPLGIHMRVVPEMSSLTSLEEKAKATFLRARQDGFCKGIMHKNSAHLEFLDLESSTLGFSLRHLLMDISTEEGDQVFHSINAHWNASEGHIVSFSPKMEHHATTILSCPLTFLRHKYSHSAHPALQKMFPVWSIRKANKSTWDVGTGTIITQELTHMNELAGEIDSQWDFSNIDMVKEDAQNAQLQENPITAGGGLQNVATPDEGSLGADSKTTFRGDKVPKKKGTLPEVKKKVSMDSSVKAAPTQQTSYTSKDDLSMADTLSSYVTIEDLDSIMTNVAKENRKLHEATKEATRIQLETSLEHMASLFSSTIDSAIKTALTRSEQPEPQPGELEASTPRAGTGLNS